MRTFIRSSSVKTPASAKSPTKINLSRVTSKINTGLTISRKGAAPPSPRGTEDSSKSTKKEFSFSDPMTPHVRISCMTRAPRSRSSSLY
ncbi:uncharacterized protein LOC143989361 isoform X3 [Lithobates pipiens]